MSKDKTSITPLVFLFLTIIILWVSSGFALWHFLPDWNTRGTFGDTFGGVNSLFSGLAFAGVIYTILLQRKELMYQREELKMNRIELARSASAQEKSEKALSDQSDILRKTLIYQSFAALTNEYREAHMLQGVKRLWDFYREVGDEKLVSEYTTIMKFDAEKIDKAPDDEKINMQQGSLHFQRRNVSQFYSRIATFIDEGIIPEDIFYSSWGETDLQIIPKVLIPLENGLRIETIGNKLPKLGDDSPLMQLYLKSRNYSNIA